MALTAGILFASHPIHTEAVREKGREGGIEIVKRLFETSRKEAVVSAWGHILLLIVMLLLRLPMGN